MKRPNQKKKLRRAMKEVLHSYHVKPNEQVKEYVYLVVLRGAIKGVIRFAFKQEYYEYLSLNKDNTLWPLFDTDDDGNMSIKSMKSIVQMIMEKSR